MTTAKSESAVSAGGHPSKLALTRLPSPNLLAFLALALYVGVRVVPALLADVTTFAPARSRLDAVGPATGATSRAQGGALETGDTVSDLEPCAPLRERPRLLSHLALTVFNTTPMRGTESAATGEFLSIVDAVLWGECLTFVGPMGTHAGALIRPGPEATMLLAVTAPQLPGLLLLAPGGPAWDRVFDVSAAAAGRTVVRPQGVSQMVHVRWCHGDLAGPAALDLDIVGGPPPPGAAGLLLRRSRRVEREAPPPSDGAVALWTLVHHVGAGAWRDGGLPTTGMLLPWMRHHWGLGVRAFVVYVNCDDLGEYVASPAWAAVAAFHGVTTLVEWRVSFRGNFPNGAATFGQMAALQSAHDHFCPSHAAMIFMDVDEYLVLDGGDESVAALLAREVGAPGARHPGNVFFPEYWATVAWPRGAPHGAWNGSGRSAASWFLDDGGDGTPLFIDPAVDVSRGKHAVVCTRDGAGHAGAGIVHVYVHWAAAHNGDRSRPATGVRVLHLTNADGTARLNFEKSTRRANATTVRAVLGGGGGGGAAAAARRRAAASECL